MPDIEEVIAKIHQRLDQGDERFSTLETSLQINTRLTQEHEINLKANTEATQRIAENTAGIVRLTTELEAGTKFLCRLAKGIQFCLEMIDRFWKPLLIVLAFCYWISHEHQFPEWFKRFDE